MKEGIKAINIQGFIAFTLNNTVKKVLQSPAEPEFMYEYSGSFYNPTSASEEFLLEVNAFGSGQTHITINGSQAITFKNLPIRSIQLLSGTLNILGVQSAVLKSYEMEPEIRYQ